MQQSYVDFHVMTTAVLYALIGIGIFAVGFYSFDRMTPYRLWQEIVEKQNVALAIMVGSVALAIGMIISAAIQG